MYGFTFRSSENKLDCLRYLLTVKVKKSAVKNFFYDVKSRVFCRIIFPFQSPLHDTLILFLKMWNILRPCVWSRSCSIIVPSDKTGHDAVHLASCISLPKCVVEFTI